jgi:hypothetical protein
VTSSPASRPRRHQQPLWHPPAHAKRSRCQRSERTAAVPTSACTALKALRIGGVAAGQQVLVVGASGGVGLFAVQIATSSGAEVTAVCSTTKVDLVRSVGADHVIDYTVEDVSTNGKRYDLPLDMGGNRTLSELWLELDSPRHPHAGRRRRRGPLGRRCHDPLATGARDVPVRPPEPANDVRNREPGGPDGPQRTERRRQRHALDRPNLPLEPGRRRDP